MKTEQILQLVEAVSGFGLDEFKYEEGGAPFVQVGDKVEKGTVLGIVEAMKLMNEIESDFDGIVEEVLVENGAEVEYGQPLFVIRQK